MEKFIKQLKADEARQMLSEIIEHIEYTMKYDRENTYQIDTEAEAKVNEAVENGTVPNPFYLAKWAHSDNMIHHQLGRMNFCEGLQETIEQAKEMILYRRKIDAELKAEMKEKELQNA